MEKGVSAEAASAFSDDGNDQKDMKRMGKKQEFVRSFRIITSIGFTSCVMGTWEVLLTTNQPALIAGGTAGLFWSTIWSYFGQAFIVLSLAELAAMAPTAGGQYHWVSEFAPRKYQKIMSYTSGWLSTLAWQAFVVVDSYVCGEVIQCLIIINNVDYVPQRWHQTLLMIGLVSLFGLFNIFLAPWLAIIEGCFAVLHFSVYLPLIVAMWVLVPDKQSGSAALLTFTNNGTGWDNIGIVVLIGQVTAMFTLLGSDAAAHMSEEIKEAGTVVPRSVWGSFVANTPATLIVCISYCFCIGNAEDALDSPTGFPIVYIFTTMTSSNAGASALTTVLLMMNFIITISCMASTSRQTFAFARDNGLPFSSWVGAVNPRLKVPVNSIILTVMFTIVLSLINIGSATAFNAFLSVSVVALMATYSISIMCILLKRVRHEPLVPARWKMIGRNVQDGEPGGGLGKYGMVVNIAALTYSFWSFFWSFWPSARYVTPSTMNWAVVIFVAIMGLAAFTYMVHARHVYDGPVAKVVQLERRDEEKTGA